MRLNSVWKFPLSTDGVQTIMVPSQHSFLTVGLDGDGARCIWMMVDAADQKRLPLEIVKVATGNGTVPHVGDYLGTINQDGYIWHYFTGPGHSANAKGSFHYLTKGN